MKLKEKKKDKRDRFSLDKTFVGRKKNFLVNINYSAAYFSNDTEQEA